MSWIPDTAIVVAFLTAAVTLYWNFHNAKAARKLPFLNKQLEFCLEAVDCVATLATTRDIAIWETSRDRFWRLYYGVLAVVEGPEVESCMVECSRFVPLTGPAPSLPASELGEASLALGQAVRKLLVDAWQIRSIEETLEGRRGMMEDIRRTYREEYDRQMAGGSAKN